MYDEEYRIETIQTSYGDVYRYVYSSDETTKETFEYECYEKNGALISATAYVYDAYGLLTDYSYFGSSTDNITSSDTSALSAINATYEYETTPTSINFGACTKEIDSLGNITSYAYYPDTGYLGSQIDVSSGTGYKYTYTPLGELESVTPFVLASNTECPENVNYTYDPAGYLTKIATDSTTYKMTYDDFGNATEIKAGNNILATYKYNQNNGKLNKVTYGNGFVVEYSYNTLELLSEIWYTNNGTKGKAFEYTYNADGTLDVLTNYLEGKNIRYTYDSRGRLIDVGEKDIDETYYNSLYRVGYNTDNKVSSQTNIITYSSENSTLSRLLTTEYSYSTNGSVSLETHTYLSDNHKIYYTYDSFNRLSAVNRDLGDFDYTSSYSYVTENSKNTSYLIGGYTNTVNGTAETYTYTYDSKGNITEVNYPNGETITYVYDDLGQLIREEHELDCKNYIYTYDDAGNLISKQTEIVDDNSDDNIGNLRAILPPLNPPSTTTTINLTYTDSEWGDLLTSYDGVSFVYDAIGNPTSYYNGTSYSFAWEGRRLVGASTSSKEMSFTYNDDGIRTSKTVNEVTHTYYLVGSTIMAEEWGDKLLVYLYDASGSPIGMMFRKTTYDIEDWDVYWFTKNLQGDIISVYNSSGNKVASYSYKNAWGDHSVSYTNLSTNEGAQYNPFRYRGYYYDSDLGMYYLQSRYYDAKICRFINADGELAGVSGDFRGFNLYAYCFNNPVMHSDHSGNWPKWLTGVANVVSGGMQMAAGFAIGVAASWTGVGAFAAAVLAVNGAATATQGLAQITNDIANNYVLLEDNIIRASFQQVGDAIGGETGANMAGNIYDGTVLAVGFYTTASSMQQALSQSMPDIVRSKLFSHNGGYGYTFDSSKLGKIELFYQNPNAKGGLGGTFFSYKGLFGKFRIDWDPAHGFHTHPPGH